MSSRKNSKAKRSKPKIVEVSISPPSAKQSKGVKNRKRKKNGKGMLSGLGKAAGSMFGPVGSAFGELAGSLVSRITGQGDYSIRGNSLLSNGPPVFTEKSGTKVTHREYLGDLYISGDGVSTLATYKVPINPGLPIMGPWMAGIARSFTEYKINGMVFELKSLVQPLSTTTSATLGTSVAFIDYDVNNDPVFTKRSYEAYEGAVSAPFTQSLLVPVECKPSLTPVDMLMVRTTSKSLAAGDLRFHDFANLHIMLISPLTTIQPIYELWVSYDMVLHKPKEAELPICAVFVATEVNHSTFGACKFKKVDELSTIGPYFQNEFGGKNIFINQLGNFEIEVHVQSDTKDDWSGATFGITTDADDLDIFGNGTEHVSTAIGSTDNKLLVMSYAMKVTDQEKTNIDIKASPAAGVITSVTIILKQLDDDVGLTPRYDYAPIEPAISLKTLSDLRNASKVLPKEEDSKYIRINESGSEEERYDEVHEILSRLGYGKISKSDATSAILKLTNGTFDIGGD